MKIVGGHVTADKKRYNEAMCRDITAAHTVICDAGIGEDRTQNAGIKKGDQGMGCL